MSSSAIEEEVTEAIRLMPTSPGVLGLGIFLNGPVTFTPSINDSEDAPDKDRAFEDMVEDLPSDTTLSQHGEEPNRIPPTPRLPSCPTFGAFPPRKPRFTTYTPDNNVPTTPPATPGLDCNSKFDNPPPRTPKSTFYNLCLDGIDAVETEYLPPGNCVPREPHFHLLNKLPPELHIMIWENAIPGPRTISMAVAESISIMQQTAHQPVPTVLHICSLSRHIALKALAPAFAHNTFATKNSNYIYVNFSIDTLRLPVETTKALANPMSVIRDKFLPTINRIQRIEMYFDICYAIPMCRAMARVALFSPFGAWPSIRKWSFRGKNETKQKQVVSLVVKRARNKDEAMSAVRFQRLTDAFFMALQQAIKKHGSDAELGLDVTYCTHSLKKKGCNCL